MVTQNMITKKTNSLSDFPLMDHTILDESAVLGKKVTPAIK